MSLRGNAYVESTEPREYTADPLYVYAYCPECDWAGNAWSIFSDDRAQREVDRHWCWRNYLKEARWYLGSAWGWLRWALGQPVQHWRRGA